MPDPYRVLGVPPSADGAAIRTAYRALMKRYHPDQNSSDEAAGRASEVAAAYAVLSEPARRADYDRQRLAVEPRASAAAVARHRPARGRAGGMLLVVLSAGLVAFAVTRPPAPSVRPRSQPTQQSAAAPPSPAAEMPQLEQDALPEPPLPVAEAAVRPVPQVVALPHPAAAPPAREAVLLPIPVPQRRPVLPLAPLTKDTCDTAASCPAIDLAALEHHLALLTDQSLRNADPETRALLVGSQAAFQSRMARCTSATCKRDAFLARNREIAILMRG